MLQSQIAMTPERSYRKALESHLEETRDHASRVQRRLDSARARSQPGRSRNRTHPGTPWTGTRPWQGAVNLLPALGRPRSRFFNNGRDACYLGNGRIQRPAPSSRTLQARRQRRRRICRLLRAPIPAHVLRMLERVLAEIPKLTEAVVQSEIHGNPSYDITKTGAADAARAASEKVKKTSREAAAGAKRSARQARKVPGVAQAEGQIKGAMASEKDLAIASYNKLTAAEIIEKLADLSQVDLAKIDSYERKNENRTTILSRITSLRSDEPWPGYDELSVSEIRTVLHEGDEVRTARVRSYERSHKNRSGVIDASDRELAKG